MPQIRLLPVIRPVAVAIGLGAFLACNHTHNIDDSGLLPRLTIVVAPDPAIPTDTLVIAASCRPCLSAVEVYLDGINKGYASCSQETSFAVSAGNHVIQFQPSSSPSPVTISAGEGPGVRVSVSCGPQS